jgi:hypothetical protein
MKKWQVQLKGHPYDLEDVFENQQSKSWSIILEGDDFFLESDRFKDLQDDDEVRQNAQRLIELINGSAKLRIPGFRSIEIGRVSRIDENGSRHHFVQLKGSVSARSKLRAAAIVAKSNGIVKEKDIENPDRILSTYELAEDNENVADALRLYGKAELSWVDLYKIYEIIRDDVGNVNDLLNRQYVLKKDLSRFTHTAQHPGVIGDEARHARVAADVPKDPMSIVEANLLISTLLSKWIDSKVQEDR